MCNFSQVPYANKADRRANDAKMRARNRQKCRDSWMAWKLRNVEKEKKRLKDRYELHKPEVLAKMKAEYEANPEPAKKRASNYRRKYPEKCRSWDAKRRAIKKANFVGNTGLIEKWERRWRKLASVTCYWCLSRFVPKECHADHVIALNIGGAHSIENMCIACLMCNSTKKAKSLAEWNKYLAAPVLF